MRSKERVKRANDNETMVLATIESHVVNQRYKELYGPRNKAPKTKRTRLTEPIPSTGILISLFSFMIEWFPVPQLLYNLL